MLHPVLFLAAATFALPAANTAPTQVAAISQRIADKPDILGTPQCRFRMIPELLLTDNKPPVVKTAAYQVAPREGGGKSRFAIGAQSGDRIANWEGILAEPQIVLISPAHQAVQITRAAIAVDGVPIPVEVAPFHQESGSPDKPFYADVSVQPTRYNPGGLLAAIARGSILTVRLYAGSRQVSQWTFDVAMMRHVPAALKGARWTCN